MKSIRSMVWASVLAGFMILPFAAVAAEEFYSVKMKAGDSVVICKSDSFSTVVNKLNQELVADRLTSKVIDPKSGNTVIYIVERPYTTSAPALMMVNANSLYARACVTVTKQ